MSAISLRPPLLRLLLLLACAMLACAMLALPAPARAAETGDPAALRERALDLVNRARRQHGREPLTLSDTLNGAAQAHAEDMLRRDYYSHVSPEGEDVADRFRARGGSRWALVAENIASCSPCAGAPDTARVERLHQGWMDSPEHRANILRPGLAEFGFGIAAGPDGPLYAVQTFAGPGTPRGAGSGDAAVPLASAGAADAFAQALNQRRQAQSLAPLERNPALSELAAGLLPRSATGEIDLNPPGGLIAALPPEARGDWRSLSVLAGSCGGCGTRATAADIRYFLDFWMDDDGSAHRLLDRDLQALGFALRAFGDGRKVAVTVLGQRR